MTISWLSLEPEVPGGIGDESQFEIVGDKRVFSELHVVFDGWLGDDILTCIGCLFATQKAIKQLTVFAGDSIRCSSMKITKSDEFRELFGNVRLPRFEWFQLSGNAYKDSIAVDKKGKLIVSEEVCNILRAKLELKHCDFKSIKQPRKR